MSWRDILKAKKNKNIKELVERWDALQNDRFALLYFTGSQKKAIREYKNKQAIKERNEEYNKIGRKIKLRPLLRQNEESYSIQRVRTEQSKN